LKLPPEIAAYAKRCDAGNAKKLPKRGARFWRLLGGKNVPRCTALDSFRAICGGLGGWSWLTLPRRGYCGYGGQICVD
jgi:hypothetical protein